MRRWLGLLLVLFPVLIQAAEPALRLAIREQGDDRLYSLAPGGGQTVAPLPADFSTPLGSLWKLFVYAWLEDNGIPEQPLQCRGGDPQEVYCCEPGNSITRETALVRSCGLYFAPARLGIDDSAWHQYWSARQGPQWLISLSRLAPQTRVPVVSLLDVLATLPGRQKAREVLLDVLLDSTKPGVAGALGGRLRVKTWSWLADNDPQARQGGMAGWLTDGTPLWVGGAGTSQMLLNRHAERLNALLPLPANRQSGQCVLVNLFTRYPISAVRPLGGEPLTASGALRGRYQVTFTRGSRIEMESRGDTWLMAEGDSLTLVARIDREEYVARVLDREASSTPPEAAKALAVAIRSYLLQNAGRSGECLSITDSSASQRVSPSPASRPSRAIAAWTEDLILAGGSVNYHSDRASPGVLSWRQAQEQAARGMRYDAILAHAFPDASLSRWGNPLATCQPLPEAKAWLETQQPRWRARLNREPGYQPPQAFAVCRKASGFPYTDRQQKRLYIREFFTLQDRLDLTHEYLHLAFDGYPSGHDEQYIESLTRHLLMD
ncbi:DUF2300 domain-containing protein [Entomohabitans teleogrylli]|uniref:DUF2300 domain-containing protein n=1 Tax=Entomohabitans teleogrylli TaxID=1384589 RepID=UPI00073D3141|nr:DUF2300 domain-containing protein [Entomohabitans teleogrylli]